MGGRGFIGRYVCDKLKDPLIFDRRKTEIDKSQYLGDITDREDVAEAMAHVDGFIHLAGVLGTQETIFNPYPAVYGNVIGGINVLQAAAQHNIPGVYIGVGNHWMDNPYSITKTTIERFVNMYNRDRGTKINIVRAVNAYGPRQVPAHPYGPSKIRKITPSFICRALKNDPIELYGGGHQISDMIYVEDVAEALVRSLWAACEGKVFDRIVEIGPKQHNTVREVAELIIKLTGSKSEIVDIPMRPGEIPGSSVTADTHTLDYVGMNPDELMPLEEGMKKTIAYYDAYLHQYESPL